MKKWLPFTITFVLAAGTAAGVWIWKGSEIRTLETPVNGPVLTRPRDLAAGPGRKLAATKTGESPETAKLNTGVPPTRNGVRHLAGRAARILEMDREELEALLTELELAGEIRSPLAGVSLMVAYARLAEMDPEAAMQRVLAAKGERREMALFGVMNEWVVRDRRAALAWFSSSTDEKAKSDYFRMAAFGVAGSDPELISELSAALHNPEDRRKAMLDSLGALAFSDPDAALKQLEKIEDPEAREEAEGRVYQGFLLRYPEKALDYAMSKPVGDRARDNARQALVQWGNQDAGAALNWLTSQKADIRKELFDSGDQGPGFGFGKATAEQIGEAARKLGDRTQQDKLYATWANSQTWTNPKAGLNQLSNIKDPELQRLTAESIGSGAARAGKTTDLEQWMQTAPPNDTRDAVVASFATGLAQNNPKAGLEWAGKITNAAIRNRTLEAVKTSPPAQFENR